MMKLIALLILSVIIWSYGDNAQVNIYMCPEMQMETYSVSTVAATVNFGNDVPPRTFIKDVPKRNFESVVPAK